MHKQNPKIAFTFIRKNCFDRELRLNTARVALAAFDGGIGRVRERMVVILVNES